MSDVIQTAVMAGAAGVAAIIGLCWIAKAGHSDPHPFVPWPKGMRRPKTCRKATIGQPTQRRTRRA